MPSMTRIYVPADSAALALGADDVAIAGAAEATRLGVAVEIVRNGSRGMHWLEPLVEVQTASGRIGYGPVTVSDVPRCLRRWPCCPHVCKKNEQSSQAALRSY